MMPWSGPGKPGSKRKFDPVDLVTNSINNGTVQELFPDLFDPNDDAPDSLVPKRSRNTPARPDYWDSNWGRMLISDKEKMMLQPNCREARRFRRRFRVPPKIFFDVFLPQVERIFDFENRSVKFTVPAVFKALIVLRILGRDATADDCVEHSKVSEAACNSIFIKFLKDYATLYYDEYVYFPKPGSAELAKIMESYRVLSFTGCLGSIDASFVPWEKCDKEWKWRCTGKEGQPAVIFQCVVSHSRRVHYVSNAFCGSENDMTTIRKCAEIRHALFELYKDVEFVLYDADGKPFVVKGAYFLSDNGYPDWVSLIRPKSDPQSNTEVYFAEFTESVRKDIECFFGITKARWRFLKNAVRYHSASTISHAFRVAAILHNMLLAYDGLDDEFGDDLEETFRNILPENYDDDNFVVTRIPREYALGGASSLVSFFDIYRPEGKLMLQAIKETMPSKEAISYSDLPSFTKALVKNFQFMYETGNLWWPKSLKKKNCSDAMIRNLPLVERMRDTLRNHLEIRHLPDNKTILVCNIDIMPNTAVVFFKGAFLSQYFHAKLSPEKQTMYIVSPHPNFYLEKKDGCHASAARCGFSSAQGLNCRLMIDTKAGLAHLQALIFIQKGSEIIYYVRTE